MGGSGHSRKVTGPRKADTRQDEETCIVRASGTSAPSAPGLHPEVQAGCTGPAGTL